MARKFTIGQKLRYEFDNFMAKGTKAQLIGLSLATLVSIGVFSTVILVLELSPKKDASLPGVLWDTSTKVLRPMPPGWMPEKPGFMAVMFAVLLVGMFVMSLLVGILTSGFRSLIVNLQRGRSFVPVTDHTLILGWSPTIVGVIKELIIANESEQGGHIVILANKDKIAMDDELRSAVPDPGKTKLVTRQGQPFSPADLRLVNVEGARSVIVLSPPRGPDRRQQDLNPDVEIIKILMAIVNSTERSGSTQNVVASIAKPKNVEVARRAAKGGVSLIPSTEVISKITAQTCRQPGLPVVYSEIMSFEGHEIYFYSDPSLIGHAFGDALLRFRTSCLLGLYRQNGELILNPKHGLKLEPSDELIILAEDNDTICVETKEQPIDQDAIAEAIEQSIDIERTIVLGWNTGAPTILKELDGYVSEGSHVTVLVPSEREVAQVKEIEQSLERQRLECRVGDATDAEELATLDVCSYDHVIILRYDDIEPAKSDSMVLVSLLHVRHALEESNRNIAVVSEFVLEQNSRIARAARDDDFIVGEHLVGLLFAQVSENKRLNEVFGNLLSEEGSEIYLKPVNRYVKPERAVDFFTVTEAARRRGEVAMGFRRLRHKADPSQNFGVVLNPDKDEKYVFEAEDSIVVLAEGYLD